MKIALHDADGTRFPNLALMKLSAYHKRQGHEVSNFLPLCADTYDIVYSSKVFSFTEESPYLPDHTIKGGTGYGIFADLDAEICKICPDYSNYSLNYSLGFLTRGCIRSCPWCVVPKKEGTIHAYQDIEDFCRHQEAVLMDNNVLAHEHGIKQLEKIAKLRIKVDFNQGLDARLIDKQIAKILSKIRWLKPVRLACDTKEQMPIVEKAVNILRDANVTPKRYFCYVLVKDIDDAHERVTFLSAMNVVPFAQPYRDFENNTLPDPLQQKFARWVNMRAAFKSTSWENYKYK